MESESTLSIGKEHILNSDGIITFQVLLMGSVDMIRNQPHHLHGGYLQWGDQPVMLLIFHPLAEWRRGPLTGNRKTGLWKPQIFGYITLLFTILHEVGQAGTSQNLQLFHLDIEPSPLLSYCLTMWLAVGGDIWNNQVVTIFWVWMRNFNRQKILIDPQTNKGFKTLWWKNIWRMKPLA